MNKVQKDEKSGCWVWTGSKRRGKYVKGKSVERLRGELRMGGVSGKNRLAHIVSYEHFVGPVPEGMELDHHCHNTLCVNPDHLEPVTHTVNMQRRMDSGLPHCKHGHLYTPETTYINIRGRRECKVCIKARNVARLAT